MGLKDFLATMNQAVNQLQEEHKDQLKKKQEEINKERSEAQAVNEKLQKILNEGMAKDEACSRQE